MTIIYHAFCLPTGEAYVGQTMFSLDKRRKGHLADARRGKQTKFYEAIRKYGCDAFQWSILFEFSGSFSQDDVNKAEDYWIRHLNTLHPHGLNLRGGGSCGIMSEETKRKIANSRTGKRHSAATRKLMSRMKLGTVRDPSFGQKMKTIMKDVWARKRQQIGG